MKTAKELKFLTYYIHFHENGKESVTKQIKSMRIVKIKA